MKKLTFLLGFALLGLGIKAHAQEDNPFNRWSIELNAGVHKPTGEFAPGYFTNTPDFFQGDVGVRYMFTNRFGLKASYGYENFESDEKSADFKSTYSRISLEGVINAGDIFNFRSWSDRINILFHGGGGYSMLTPKEPVERDTDQMLHIMAGITPQIRLSDHLALTLDGTAIGNIRQSYTYDGTSSASGDAAGVDALIVNASIGFTVYLGSNEKHADWYNSAEDGLGTELDSIANRLAKVEDDLQDSDQDGVPDYLDREPNTTNGVAVNSKGQAVDKNGNGIPDELEGSLDERYNKAGENTASTQSEAIFKLIDEGYVNVYFKFNSTEPEAYSLQSINYLVKYMQENSSANAELIGYADEIGNPTYNKSLSEKRAKKVYDILVASGIDSNRLSYTGGGEDNSVDKASSGARQMVRRVTFKLK